MKLGYADPPYIGCAHLYKGHPDYAGEVDHGELLGRLESEFDGWVLHASATPTSIATLAPLVAQIDGARWMSWVKGFAAFKRNVPVAYAWEPVIIKPARKPVVSKRLVMRDWIQESITLKRGLTGAKPEAVCHWAFECLGARPDDALEDIFPGTGAVQKHGRRGAANLCCPLTIRMNSHYRSTTMVELNEKALEQDRARLIHILVVHLDMLRDRAEEAADLFLHDKIIGARRTESQTAHYSAFDDWFAGQEGVAIRAERFEGDVEWLRAAFDAGHTEGLVDAAVRDESQTGAVRVKATHRHKKRGTEYVLIGIGKMQSDRWQVGPDGIAGPVDMREVAVYRSATDPTEIWVRPREEFEDGRFEVLEPTPTKETA